MLAVIITLLLITSPVMAFDEWDRTDYALLATATALQVIDWRQTRRIAEDPGRYWERNPLLPNHPSRGQVDQYFAASFLIRVGVAHILPSRWRKIWLGGVTAMSLGCVIQNDHIGLGVQW